MTMFHQRQNAEKGRHLVATSDTAPGITILEEKGFSQIVIYKDRRDVCAVCFRPADPDLQCDLCSKVAFCSMACEGELEAIHELECESLEEVDRISKKYDVDVDLLRLVIRILCTKAAGPLPDVAATFVDVYNMISALDQLSLEWKKSIQNAATELVPYFPPEICENEKDASQLFLEVAGRVNENSHALGSVDNPDAVRTIGMFPTVSLLNHSCRPNCEWSIMMNGQCQVRTVEFVPSGDEFTVAYIDTNLPRQVRQSILKDTKHFDCRCLRCFEPLEDSDEQQECL